jgi:hypothetical protein
MMFSRWLAGAAASMTIAAILGVAAPAAQAAPATQAAAAERAIPASYTPPSGVVDPCPQASSGLAGCAALISTPAAGGVAGSAASRSAAGREAASAAASAPPGNSYAPADLQKAYAFESAAEGSGQTVALVTPYDDPDAASDLATYRSGYGISPCTVADGCFKKVSQTGTSSLPPAEAGWSSPVAESIDMISAICPNCHILIVEASTTALTDLGTAENEAVTLGATSVVNDWYIPEAQLGSAETTYDSEYFDHPGVAITAPGGDDGYGVTYPAASQYVTAVGGTTLTADSSAARGFTETAWAGSNSGCSAYEPKPSWQTDTGCADRTLNDLAADADPSTPVAYYDTPTEGGWGGGGGTVAAAAIVAAAYALAGTPAAGTYPASYPYRHPGGSYTTPGNAYTSADGLNNITTGSDGTCSVTYLCTAGPGYNGPTGLGTPDTTLSLASAGSQNGHLYNGTAGICMDDAGDATTNGNKIQAWDCLSNANQDWTAQANGTITIATSYCLTLTGGGTASGTTAELDPCTAGSAGQQWAPQGNGEIKNPASGLCLNNPAGTANGTQLDITACATTPAAGQTWTIQPARPASAGPVTSKITASKCVDDTGDATTNGNKIQIWDCLGNADQNWDIQSTGVIQLNGTGGCLTASNDGTTNATPIVYYTCDGDPSQHWTEHSDGSLVNLRSGLCFADPNADDTNGTQLQLSACNSQVQQTWTLP